jgi:hypothetical protein
MPSPHPWDPLWTQFAIPLLEGLQEGASTDAAIALAIYEAGARMLLTWNVKHFIAVAPVGLEIRHPSITQSNG